MKRSLVLSAAAAAILLVAGSAWAAAPVPDPESAPEGAVALVEPAAPETAAVEVEAEPLALTPAPESQSPCPVLQAQSALLCEFKCRRWGCEYDHWNSLDGSCYCGDLL